jgi:hypothetical protein
MASWTHQAPERRKRTRRVLLDRRDAKVKKAVHSCTAHGRAWCWRCFLITASFPIEHFIWVKLPYLRNLSPYFGL